MIAGPSAIQSDVRDWYELEIDPGIDPEPNVYTSPEALTWVDEGNSTHERCERS